MVVVSRNGLLLAKPVMWESPPGLNCNQLLIEIHIVINPSCYLSKGTTEFLLGKLCHIWQIRQFLHEIETLLHKKLGLPVPADEDRLPVPADEDRRQADLPAPKAGGRQAGGRQAGQRQTGF
jgi:hypothetical protein